MTTRSGESKCPKLQIGIALPKQFILKKKILRFCQESVSSCTKFLQSSFVSREIFLVLLDKGNNRTVWLSCAQSDSFAYRFRSSYIKYFRFSDRLKQWKPNLRQRSWLADSRSRFQFILARVYLCLNPNRFCAVSGCNKIS